VKYASVYYLEPYKIRIVKTAGKDSGREEAKRTVVGKT
jgi:hypothetical protein